MSEMMHQAGVDERDLSELDRLLNDPEVPMQAARVWDLLDKLREPSPAKR